MLIKTPTKTKFKKEHKQNLTSFVGMTDENKMSDKWKQSENELT